MLQLRKRRDARMSDEKLVSGAKKRMEKHARKWLRHPAVKAVVHRRDANPDGEAIAL